MLTVVAGCMFSGKTTWLLRHIARYPPDKVSAFKHAWDRRYCGRHIVSHAGATHPCQLAEEVSDIRGLLAAPVRCVAIDEGHFFPDELADIADRFRVSGLDCVVAGLDRNSWGRPFPHMLKLLRMADRPIVCRTRCAQCGGAANRTQRLTPIVNGNLVGGAADYEPRCARCWHAPPEAPVEFV